MYNSTPPHPAGPMRNTPVNVFIRKTQELQQHGHAMPSISMGYNGDQKYSTHGSPVSSTSYKGYPGNDSYGGHMHQGLNMEPVEVIATANMRPATKDGPSVQTELVFSDVQDAQIGEDKKKAKIRHQVKLRTRKYRQRLKEAKKLTKEIDEKKTRSEDEKKLQHMIQEQLQIVKSTGTATQRTGLLRVYNELFRDGIDLSLQDQYKKQVQFANVFFDKNIENATGGYKGLMTHLRLGMHFNTICASIRQRLKSMYVAGDHVICQTEFKIQFSRTTLEHLYPHLFDRMENGSFEPKPEFLELVQKLDYCEIATDYRQDFLFQGGKAVRIEVETNYMESWMKFLKNPLDVARLLSPSQAEKALTESPNFKSEIDDIQQVARIYANGKH